MSLGGAVTEIVFALGAGDEIVARDTSSVFPAAALALPDVGYFRTIGAEGVLAQRPTLILAAQGTGPESQLDQLKRSGVRFLHLDGSPSGEAVAANLSRVGELLGRDEQAAVLVQELRAKLDAVGARSEAAGRRPRVIFLMGMGPANAQAAYAGTAAAALIQLAGGDNPLSGPGLAGYKAINPEALFAADPDFILYGVNPHAPGHSTPPEWVLRTRAGRQGRVHALDLGYHLVFGPRLGSAVDEVSRLIHPATP